MTSIPYRSHQLQPDCERCGAILAVLGECQHELRSLVYKDAIAIIAQETGLVGCVWRTGMQAIHEHIEHVVEVQLRRESGGASIGANPRTIRAPTPLDNIWGRVQNGFVFSIRSKPASTLKWMAAFDARRAEIYISQQIVRFLSVCFI